MEGTEEYSIQESRYPRDGRPVRQDEENWLVPWYRATEPEPNIVSNDAESDKTIWKPSIFMPRWASRTLLEITDLRAQKIQEISEEECKAEGVNSKAEFEKLWNAINSARGYGWVKNCWVWAIEFKVVQRQK